VTQQHSPQVGAVIQILSLCFGGVQLLRKWQNLDFITHLRAVWLRIILKQHFTTLGKVLTRIPQMCGHIACHMQCHLAFAKCNWICSAKKFNRILQMRSDMQCYRAFVECKSTVFVVPTHLCSSPPHALLFNSQGCFSWLVRVYTRGVHNSVFCFPSWFFFSCLLDAAFWLPKLIVQLLRTSWQPRGFLLVVEGVHCTPWWPRWFLLVS
jgi:uncharacterized membrane protein YhdT